MLVIPEISVASREEEFKKARAAGKREFTYEGKRYNTMEAGESRKEWLKKTKEAPKSTSNKFKFKNTEKPLKTKAGKFSEWLTNTHGKKVRISSGDREDSHNHSKANAVDVVGIEKLSKEEQRKALQTAKKIGLRVGQELEGSNKTVKGSKSTAPHYHFDGGKGPDFIRGAKSGKANRKGRTSAENSQNDKFVKEMKSLKKAPMKGEVFGPSDEELKKKAPLKQKIQEAIIPKEEIASFGMGEDLKNKLSMISELEAGTEESKLAKPILDYNMKQEIEQAPKVAMVKQESDGAMELQEEIEREKKKALKELTPSVVERTMKAEAPTPKIAEKEVEDVQEAAIQRIQSPVPQKPSGSMSDQFKEALSFFAPTMIGALGGALIEGTEGAVAGAEAGTSLGTSFRDYQLKKAQLEQKKTPSPLDIAKLQVSQGNLEQRKQELEEQKRRSGSLADERGSRREERDLDRAVSFKKDFSARAEVKKFVEALNDIEDIKTLAVEGKKLPEAIQSKIARSISGEVGVLTDNDIKRAQINPDIKSTIKRKVSLWTEGKLPQTDIDDLLKVAEAIRLKKRERLRESAIGFAKSRDPHISDKGIRKRFLEDILSENGLDEPKSVQSSNRGIPSDEDIDNMSIEELRAAGLL